jgi:hypothetical protein
MSKKLFAGIGMSIPLLKEVSANPGRGWGEKAAKPATKSESAIM